MRAMQAPAVTRHRRPFLAPFWVMLLLLFLVIAAAFVAYESATTTTVVLVRHAEKELVTIDNPPLTAAGERRAERLAQIFGTPKGVGRIEGLYVTDTRRTQQTVMPLATRLGLTATIVPAGDVKGMVSRVMHDHRGGTALIVAHSNTLPEIIERLADIKIPPIGDDEYDDIYIVTVPTFGKVSVLRLKY
jgi:broad specificity phosphatase PhoE